MAEQREERVSQAGAPEKPTPPAGERKKGPRRGRTQWVSFADRTTGEVVHVKHDPYLREALLSQGVELGQLVPRSRAEFSDGKASEAIVDARYKSFQTMQQGLMDIVLRARRTLKSHAEAKRAYQAQQKDLAERQTPRRQPSWRDGAGAGADAGDGGAVASPRKVAGDGVTLATGSATGTGDLLAREQEHMQKVLEAAYRRVTKEKAMEKEHEIRAQELIAGVPLPPSRTPSTYSVVPTGGSPSQGLSLSRN
jgi:hypothetical protein